MSEDWTCDYCETRHFALGLGPFRADGRFFCGEDCWDVWVTSNEELASAAHDEMFPDMGAHDE